MGQKDILLKRYFSDEARFADLLNGVIGAENSIGDELYRGRYRGTGVYTLFDAGALYGIRSERV